MVPVAVASCVSQLLAHAAPVAYTNRVCAEGLHFSAFHFIVLIEHIVDWNIQTRLSEERPIIHRVRLSVAYSIASEETERFCSTCMSCIMTYAVATLSIYSGTSDNGASQ